MNYENIHFTRHLTEGEGSNRCNLAVTILNEGHSQVRIAQILNVDQSSISRVLRRYGKHSYARHHDQGRLTGRATTAAQDRFIPIISNIKKNT